MVKSKEKKNKKPRIIKVTTEQKDNMLAALNKVELPSELSGLRDFVEGLINGNAWLCEKLKDGTLTIAKLRKIFAITTEKNPSNRPKKKANANGNEKSNDPPKGHGRNKAEDYTAAVDVDVSHQLLNAGNDCPAEDCDGTLYALKDPGIVVRITGGPLAQVTRYNLQKLRCNLCSVLFTASLPAGVGDKKYDTSFVAMLMIHKYFISVPYYRQEKLQQYLGAPLPSSTQWDLIKAEEEVLAALYKAFRQDAANGKGISFDDTKARILEQIAKAKAKQTSVTGELIKKTCYTTGIVSVHESHRVYLYVTDDEMAGKSLAPVLQLRDKTLAEPLLMCDALTANIPEKISKDLYILCYCLVHARRQFYDLGDGYSDLTDNVMALIGEIYDNDEATKKLDANARLEFHKERSQPLMDKLKNHLLEHEKEFEPNSAAGKAIQYMLKRWTNFTRFLTHAGAQLDNNITERALKLVIQTRKSSLFYKTLKGARIASYVQTALYSAAQNNINPYKYMQVILDNRDYVIASPKAWLPQNYEATLKLLEDGNALQAVASDTSPP